MSTRSLTWLSALLAVTNTVSAAPFQQKRDSTVWVTATIYGEVVSWINNWPDTATSTASNGADWVTATIDGQVVSWVNNWPPSTATAITTPTSAAPVPTTTTAAPTTTAVPTTTADPTTTTAPTTTAAPTSIVSPSASPSNTDPSCKDIHIFLVKGWNEPYPGRQGKLTGAICYGLQSCDYEDVQYHNAEGSEFCPAAAEGDRNGVAQMSTYAERCPASKLVLSGYSQGANIVGDIVGGGDRPDCTEGIATGLNPLSGPGSKLGAILLFGDPEHAGNQPFNVLSGSGQSSYVARNGSSLARMNEFASITRSYCDVADSVCAAAGPGPFDINTHLNYFDLYTDHAAGWVKSILGY